MKDTESLFKYRLEQAEETLLDAKRMLKENFSTRSITSRAYYFMFYAVLALFLKTGISVKTSKHVGVITLFDKEFIRKGKIDKYYSKILHEVFDIRLEGDYKEFVDLTKDDAAEHVRLAEKFINCIKDFLNLNTE